MLNNYTYGIYAKPRKTASANVCHWLYFLVWLRVAGMLKSAHAKYIIVYCYH